MSGGLAYVLDEAGDFKSRCNEGMVDLEPVVDTEDVETIKALRRQISSDAYLPFVDKMMN